MLKLFRTIQQNIANFFLYCCICTSIIGLVSCGGAPLDNPNYLEQNGLGQTFVVTVAGLNGTVVVDVGGRQLTFTEDGTASEGGYPDGDITARIVSSPDDQDCLFSPSNLAEIIAAPSVTVSCAVPGISGTIKNFFTGDEISEASVIVYSVVNSESSEFASIITASDGSYLIPDTVPGTRYVLSVTASGFAPQVVVALPLESRPAIVENITLVPENSNLTVDPTASMSFVVNDVTILEIPANGLVDSDGNAPVGNVTARITLLDPSSGSSALPGRYDIDSEGSIESFGGVAIVIIDTEGDELGLAAGVSAELNIPVATKSIGSSPASGTLYLFDGATGYWQNGASASLGTDGGASVYNVTTLSMSAILSVGSPYTAVSIQGCIQDSGGNPVVGVTVVSQGGSYLGLAYGVTDSSGNFSVPARASSDVFVFGLLGARSRTSSVTTTTGTSVISDCLLFDFSSVAISLTWGQSPSDLDSHLYGPQPDTADRFHVYYVDREVIIGSQTIFLDVDDVTSFGPEITTIPSFPEEGVYEFLVHNFSGTGSIFDSPARVELNSQGENFAFSPPEGTPSLCWHVFNIVVDSALRGEVEPVNSWVAESICTVTGSVAESTSEVGSVPEAAKISSGQQAIEQKYYAR